MLVYIEQEVARTLQPGVEKKLVGTRSRYALVVSTTVEVKLSRRPNPTPMGWQPTDLAVGPR
jgi:hypothetical protein